MALIGFVLLVLLRREGVERGKFSILADLTPPIKEETRAMGMMSEFREFAVKGNVVDLAVGVIIGAAFGKIVDSLVGDLIMPVVGKFFGGLDFTQYYVALAPIPANVAHTLADLKKAGIPVIAWGNFVNILMNFVILAFIVFIMVKQINRLRERKPATPAAPPEDVVLLREIRDALVRK
jgi:large conductance mechanosensitive channel